MHDVSLDYLQSVILGITKQSAISKTSEAILNDAKQIIPTDAILSITEVESALEFMIKSELVGVAEEFRINYYWNKEFEFCTSGKLRVSVNGSGFLAESDPLNRSIFVPPPVAKRYLHDDVLKVSVRPSKDIDRWVVSDSSRVSIRPSYVARLKNRGVDEAEVFAVDNRIRNIFIRTSERFTHNQLYKITPHMNDYGVLSHSDYSCIGPDHTLESMIAASLTEHQWTAHPDAFLSDLFLEKNAPHMNTERVNLQHLPFIAIDGKSTLDRDDAIYAEKTENGFILRVAISDVDDVVRIGSELDSHVCEVGTSLYLPNYTLPMLPRHISEQSCSLNAGHVRNVLIFEIVYDLRCDGVDTAIKKTVYLASINVRHNLSYDDVNELISPHSDESTMTAPLLRPDEKEALFCLEALASHLDDVYRGFANLRIEHSQLRSHIDENGNIDYFYHEVMTASHKMVANCMLEAGRCGGAVLLSHGSEGMFRVQAAPDYDELLKAQRSLELFMGLPLTDCAPLSDEPIQLLLNECDRKGREIPEQVRILVFRSFSRSFYSEDDGDHYGLGFSGYAQVTSPIRRLGDLINHRLLKCIISGRGDLLPYTNESMCALAKQATASEQKATQTHRTFMQLAHHNYLRALDGSFVDATVLGMSSASIFVRIKDTAVDVNLPIYQCRPRLKFDREQHSLSSENGLFISLGSSIKMAVDFKSDAYNPCSLVV